MRNVTKRVLAGAAMALAFGMISLPAQAETVMQKCSAQYKADKAAGKLKAGESWTKYYSSCAKSMKTGAKATKSTTKAATRTEKKAEKTARSGTKKPQTPAQIAAHKRQKECGAMWRKDKAAGKIKKGQTWPQYWHECSQKLKK